MSTRDERDRARLRCLAVAISSLNCEIARIVQAGENPQELDRYAQESLAMGEVGDHLIGLSLDELVELLGSIAAIEKLLGMGHEPENIQRLLEQGPRVSDANMRRDILLYLEGISKDREVVVPSGVEA